MARPLGPSTRRHGVHECAQPLLPSGRRSHRPGPKITVSGCKGRMRCSINCKPRCAWLSGLAGALVASLPYARWSVPAEGHSRDGRVLPEADIPAERSRTRLTPSRAKEPVFRTNGHTRTTLCRQTCASLGEGPHFHSLARWSRATNRSARPARPTAKEEPDARELACSLFIAARLTAQARHRPDAVRGDAELASLDETRRPCARRRPATDTGSGVAVTERGCSPQGPRGTPQRYHSARHCPSIAVHRASLPSRRRVDPPWIQVEATLVRS